MKKYNYLTALFVVICTSEASANVILTSRNSTSSAEASHQTLNQPADGYGYDADSTTTIFGDSSSAASATPYDYGARASTSVSLSGSNLYISGQATASTPPSGSFSFARSQSYIELDFTVDSTTHIDLTLSQDRVDDAGRASGLMQLFKGNALLTSVTSQTDYHQQIPFPQYLSLDLDAGDYRIVGNYSTRADTGTCTASSFCEASGSIQLTTNANISAVPLPSAMLLMSSSLAGLITVKRRKVISDRL